jgi:hypothetical protein
MNINPKKAKAGGKMMEFLALLGFLVVWIFLQAWLLPRLGVKT